METDTESTLQEYQIQLEQVTQEPKNNQTTLILYTFKSKKGRISIEIKAR